MLAIVFRLFSIISNTEFHNVYFVMQNLEYVSDINMGQAQPHQKVLGYFVLWDVWRCDSGYYLFLYSRKYFCQVRGILEHLPSQDNLIHLATVNQIRLNSCLYSPLVPTHFWCWIRAWNQKTHLVRWGRLEAMKTTLLPVYNSQCEKERGFLSIKFGVLWTKCFWTFWLLNQDSVQWLKVSWDFLALSSQLSQMTNFYRNPL